MDPAAALRKVADTVDASRSGTDDHKRLIAALIALRELRTELAEWEPELITAARTAGASWAALAPALGVASRQAAERRYLRLQPRATGEATGEARVRAHRDERAGDRAVAGWARQNSASLRRLAGQVTAVDGLSADAQQRADKVNEALGGDDAADLVTPLLSTRTDLATNHAVLTDQLDKLDALTAQLRRDSQSRRPHNR